VIISSNENIVIQTTLDISFSDSLYFCVAALSN
jgi:hypothetical protein